MKTQDEIKARLKAAKSFYEGRRKLLRIAKGTSTADRNLRKTVLHQMLVSDSEIETLQWILKG